MRSAASRRATRRFQAVRPGGVIVHVGLMDWASEIDMRKLTLAEITLIGTYTYSTADLECDRGGALPRRIRRSPLGGGEGLADGATAFADLDRAAARSAADVSDCAPRKRSLAARPLSEAQAGPR
jgi:alcohol dehydrogenase